MLVDLERRRPVALLPNREAGTLATWLRDHSGVAVISRDRGGAYAKGARDGAPAAVQVADRFHLLQNLAETLEVVFTTHAKDLRAAEQERRDTVAADRGTLPVPPSVPQANARLLAAGRRERRIAVHEQIWHLRSQEWTGEAIARHLGIGRSSVFRNLRHEAFPERGRRADAGHSLLDRWQHVVLEHWNKGRRDGRLTAVIGSGKTMLSRRLRADLEREGRVIVSRSLSIDKAKISLPLLEAALFYDLAPEKTVKIPSQSERRERDLQDLFRHAKKPVALFVDDAHDLHPKTLTALKRLIELVAEGGGQLSIVLVGHPKLKNDLRRPKMEEIGDRTTVFEFGGLRDRQRDYIDWVLQASLDQNMTPNDVLTDEAATLLAAKLKTPLQIGQHLVRAFEAGFEIGAKPIAAGVVEAVLSSQLDELEPRLTRNGYDLRSLVEQFDAKPAEIRRLLQGDLDAGRAQELMDEMRAAGLPA